MTEGGLGQLVGRYLQRVVNEHDHSAIDAMVSPDYRGSGPLWPTDIDKLRDFYRWQARTRPDWHIDVRESIEVGDWVAVRAHAAGTVSHDDDGQPLASPLRRHAEWMATYRIRDGMIAEIHLVVAVVTPERGPGR